MEKAAFLEKIIFVDLKNLNDGFDNEPNFYFSESDFRIVLERIEKLGIGIYAIQPWLKGSLFGTKVNEDFNKKATDSRWYKGAYFEFKREQSDLLYSAKYKVSAKLLSKHSQVETEAKTETEAKSEEE